VIYTLLNSYIPLSDSFLFSAVKGENNVSAHGYAVVHNEGAMHRRLSARHKISSAKDNTSWRASRKIIANRRRGMAVIDRDGISSVEGCEPHLFRAERSEQRDGIVVDEERQVVIRMATSDKTRGSKVIKNLF